MKPPTPKAKKGGRVKARKMVAFVDGEGGLSVHESIVHKNDLPVMILDIRDYRAMRAELKRLKTVVEDVASEQCCQAPGCSEDDPCCSTMSARAALRKGATKR